jgi:hypothetical protein
LTASSETLLTPYLFVAFSARSETKRYRSFSWRSSSRDADDATALARLARGEEAVRAGAAA